MICCRVDAAVAFGLQLLVACSLGLPDSPESYSTITMTLCC